MKTVETELVPARTIKGPDVWETRHEYCDREGGTWIDYEMYSKHQHGKIRCSFLYIGPLGTGRREWQGPILPGPYAAVITRPWVVTAWPQDCKPNKVETLEPGDVVLFHGQPMELHDDRRGYNPYFVALSPSPERSLLGINPGEDYLL